MGNDMQVEALQDERALEGSSVALRDDLDREVYCILGLPIDAVDVEETLRRIEAAVKLADPYLVSTPNINFLVASRSNAEFQESLLMSDLCLVDGVPLVWIARLVGVPLARRVSGSDMFEALKARRLQTKIKTFLFGATNDVASSASRRLNESADGVSCVGWICPGFGTFDQFSQESYIREINRSHAEFLVVALGARNGQLWLRKNHAQLSVPVRAHLGAVVNFQAGTVKRAPRLLRENGLEWLWRIKEEPRLFDRYWHDGLVVLRLSVTTIMPLALLALWWKSRSRNKKGSFALREYHGRKVTTLQLLGDATRAHVGEAITRFRTTLVKNKRVFVDMTHTTAIDARFLGLLLMLRKQLDQRQSVLCVTNASPLVRRFFDLNGVGWLIG